jgi:uncharacterized protein (TIRG00374 family)
MRPPPEPPRQPRGTGRPAFSVRPVRSPVTSADDLPDAVAPRRLGRRLLQVVALLVVLVLVAVLAPGLGDVRDLLARARPGWLALAVGFEVLSCISYVLMFRPIFCRAMSWRTSWEIGWSELGVGSLVPASGAGGLALGAWILSRGGMPAEKIARRSVAFFLIKSSVNFVAVAVVGTAMAVGLLGPHRSMLLTVLPAALSVVVLAAVLAVPRLGPGRAPADTASRTGRATAAVRRALVTGTGEAVAIMRSRDPLVIVGAVGYWAWDNAVLWATYHAVGATVPIGVVLMGYLIGQLGGLLPLPGGVGGIDGGLIGTLIVYGAPPAATVAAVLAYRLILFWVPLLGGIVAFTALRRALDQSERADLCSPARAV